MNKKIIIVSVRNGGLFDFEPTGRRKEIPSFNEFVNGMIFFIMFTFLPITLTIVGLKIKFSKRK